MTDKTVQAIADFVKKWGTPGHNAEMLHDLGQLAKTAMLESHEYVYGDVAGKVGA